MKNKILDMDADASKPVSKAAATTAKKVEDLMPKEFVFKAVLAKE